MPAVSQPPYWTASMVREIPDDGNRYECIDGEIVHPASRLVERWRAGATSAVWEDERLVWQPEGAARPLTIDLPELFDSVPEAFRKA